MGPRLRRLALTAHVVCSVGWLGAVAAFLALAVVGLTERDSQSVRAAYLAMGPVTRLVIVPAAVGSLLTGLLQSLGTSWGLWRHYWVIGKLLVTVPVVLLLLQYTQTIGQLEAAAADPATSTADLAAWGASALLHAALAGLALLVPVALSVFKPRGMTRHGWRKLTVAQAGQIARGPDLHRPEADL
jgi:hypothetical protein